MQTVGGMVPTMTVLGTPGAHLTASGAGSPAATHLTVAIAPTLSLSAFLLVVTLLLVVAHPAEVILAARKKLVLRTSAIASLLVMAGLALAVDFRPLLAISLLVILSSTTLAHAGIMTPTLLLL